MIKAYKGNKKMNMEGLSALKHLHGKEFKSVDVVNAEELTADLFYKKYVNNNVPVLIKGSVKNWPASQKWNDQYLIEAVGKKTVSMYKSMNFNNAKHRAQHCQRVEFSEALAERNLEETSPVSIPHMIMDEQWIGFDGKLVKDKLECLLPDLGKFSFTREQKKGMSSPFFRLFLYRNAGTGWHEHPVDEYLLSQIKGGKVVGLMPSRNNPYYKELHNYFATDEYLNDPSFFDKYSDFIHMVQVDEGDSLYVPPYWFHGIDTADTNPGISVVYSWRSPLHKMTDFGYPVVKEKFWQALKSGVNKTSILYCLLAVIGGGCQILRRLYLKLFKRNCSLQLPVREY